MMQERVFVQDALRRASDYVYYRRRTINEGDLIVAFDAACVAGGYGVFGYSGKPRSSLNDHWAAEVLEMIQQNQLSTAGFWALALGFTLTVKRLPTEHAFVVLNSLGAIRLFRVIQTGSEIEVNSAELAPPPPISEWLSWLASKADPTIVAPPAKSANESFCLLEQSLADLQAMIGRP